jgi:hypothetical protein
MSALAWASEHGPSSLVSCLISAGADVNAKNHVSYSQCGVPLQTCANELMCLCYVYRMVKLH